MVGSGNSLIFIHWNFIEISPLIIPIQYFSIDPLKRLFLRWYNYINLQGREIAKNIINIFSNHI